MREMLEESAKYGYAVDVKAIAEQRAKNAEIKKALRRSQLVLGPDKETDYFQANALPSYTTEQVLKVKKMSALDPKMAKQLRKTNYVLGDDRLMEYTSVMRDQFPVMKNDTDFAGIKKKQAELLKQLR